MVRNRRRRRGGRFVVLDRNRRDELVAPAGDVGDVALVGLAVSQRLAQRRDVDAEIALFHEGVGPDPRHQLGLRDCTVLGFGQHGELLFQTPDGATALTPSATVLALGGASWPQLGSTGAWVGPLPTGPIDVDFLFSNGFE